MTETYSYINDELNLETYSYINDELKNKNHRIDYGNFHSWAILDKHQNV